MKAVIQVRLKNGVLDPQGKAIESALENLGFSGLENVRQGKLIEVDIDQVDPKDVRQTAEAMAKSLLANPVIETYNIEICEE
jgi:phosphoribosylformylglycinamidine synthase